MLGSVDGRKKVKSFFNIIDRIPLISTYANIALIFHKAFLTNEARYSQKHSIEKFIHKKTYTRCFISLIPILGNLVVWISDLIEANKVKKIYARIENGQQPLADLDIKTQERFLRSSDERRHTYLKEASEEVQNHFIAKSSGNVFYAKPDVIKAFITREVSQLPLHSYVYPQSSLYNYFLRALDEENQQNFVVENFNLFFFFLLKPEVQLTLISTLKNEEQEAILDAVLDSNEFKNFILTDFNEFLSNASEDVQHLYIAKKPEKLSQLSFEEQKKYITHNPALFIHAKHEFKTDLFTHLDENGVRTLIEMQEYASWLHCAPFEVQKNLIVENLERLQYCSDDVIMEMIESYPQRLPTLGATWQETIIEQKPDLYSFAIDSVKRKMLPVYLIHYIKTNLQNKPEDGSEVLSDLIEEINELPEATGPDWLYRNYPTICGEEEIKYLFLLIESLLKNETVTASSKELLQKIYEQISEDRWKKIDNLTILEKMNFAEKALTSKLGKTTLMALKIVLQLDALKIKEKENTLEQRDVKQLLDMGLMMKFSDREVLKIASERMFTACSYWVNKLSSQDVISLFKGGSLPLTVFKRLPPQTAIDCIQIFNRPQDVEKVFQEYNFEWDKLNHKDIGKIIKILIRFNTQSMNIDSQLENIRDWIEKKNASLSSLGLANGSCEKYCEMMGGNLKFLNLIGCRIESMYFNGICHTCPNIETLKLGPTNISNVENFQESIQKLSNLKSLNFHNNSNFKINWLKDLTIENLEVLDLGYCSRVADEELVLLANHKNLRILSLEGNKNITDTGLSQLLEELENLEELNLEGCVQLTDEFLYSLKNNGKLKKLLVKGCPQINSDEALSILSEYTSLKMLSIEGLSSDGLDSLKVMHENLEEISLNLTLSNSDSCNILDLLSALKGFGNLNKFNITYKYLSDEGENVTLSLKDFSEEQIHSLIRSLLDMNKEQWKKLAPVLAAIRIWIQEYGNFRESMRFSGNELNRYYAMMGENLKFLVFRPFYSL